MWRPLPKEPSRKILVGYRNPAPNEQIPETLVNALRTSAFVTAEIIQFDGDDEGKLKLHCNAPPFYKLSISHPERWYVGRQVSQMSGEWQHPPPSIIMMFNSDFAKSMTGGETIQVSIPGKRNVRIIKKCTKWDRIRKVAPKVGKLAIIFQDLWALSQEKHYAPGGKGYRKIQQQFQKRQRQQ